MGTRRLVADREHLAWLRSLRPRVPLMASVCTGALVFAAAGLLAGRPATTHWGAFDELAEIDPSVTVDTEARFVDDGDVVTSAGVSAGIDMSLHLVARLESADVARQVRRAIQYDPAPPV
jgi:transcriptional regulator GlxA family with amidase domain